jgi:hypothetical protein
VFAGVLEFDAGELGELVFVVFAGAPQAIAKAVMQTMNSTFFIGDFLLLTGSEVVTMNFNAFPGTRHFTAV